jgi:hypothetical protein
MANGKLDLIDLKERIAINDAFSAKEREFILAAVNASIEAIHLFELVKKDPALRGGV